MVRRPLDRRVDAVTRTGMKSYRRTLTLDPYRLVTDRFVPPHDCVDEVLAGHIDDYLRAGMTAWRSA